MLVFIHTPKTGGSTLRRILRRQCQPRSSFVGLNHLDRPHECLERLAAIAAAPPGRVQAAGGHVPFGVVAPRLPHATYLTLVRDPVERVLSAYHYGLHRRTPVRSLHRYVTEGVTPANLQTRMLSGRPVSEEPTLDSLEAAVANLRERFRVVGTTERFDELLTLIRLGLGWSNVLYTRARETGARPHRDDLDAAERELILSANHLDVELHSRAGAIMDEAIAGQGKRFEEELDDLRRANDRFRRRLSGDGSDAEAAENTGVARLLEESKAEADRERARLRRRRSGTAAGG